MSLLKTQYLENRIYQQNIHSEIFNFENLDDNILVVAPTSSGKTINELYASDYYLSQNEKNIVVILAPTNILCSQHRKKFQEYLQLSEDKIKLITGETAPHKRHTLWQNVKLVFSTPNCFINDLLSGKIPLNLIKLVIFDEVHMTRKDHAYNLVAKELLKLKIRIIGFTASLGDSIVKQVEIMHNINGKEIIFLDKDNPSYAKYYKGSQFAVFLADIDDNMKNLLEIIDLAIDPIINYMVKIGHFKPNRSYSKKEILAFINMFQKTTKSCSRYRKFDYKHYIIDLYYYLIMLYIQECIITGTYYEAFKYIEEIKKSTSFPSVVFKNDEKIAVLQIYLEKLIMGKNFHPKIQILEENFSRRSKNDKVIIFVNNHYTAHYLFQFFKKRIKAKTQFVLGQKFMNTKTQLQTISDFENEKFNILIASSVAEAGIHIPNVERLTHYTPPIDGVALIQRSGRTGRTEFGLIDFILTNHEIELTRYQSALAGKKRQKKLTDLTRNTKQKKVIHEQLKLGFTEIPKRPKGKSKGRKKIHKKEPKQLTLF